jgi:hypothetical protein
VPSPSIPVPTEIVNVSEGTVSRASKWLNRKFDEKSHDMVRLIGRTTTLQPGEEEIALTGVRGGVLVGGGLGLVGGVVVATPLCGPAFPTGAPYGACVIAAGTGAMFGLGSMGGIATGWSYVHYKRGVAYFEKSTGFDLDSSPKAD